MSNRSPSSGDYDIPMVWHGIVESDATVGRKPDGDAPVGGFERCEAAATVVDSEAQEWREHPTLKGRFLRDHPDDLQVIVHDGGPRITRNRPETVWVTVTGTDGKVFRGRLLNQPHNLQSIRQGSEIKFIMPGGSEHPIMVTDKHLRERDSWVTTLARNAACRACLMLHLTSSEWYSPIRRPMPK
jgi:hypothetical protein